MVDPDVQIFMAVPSKEYLRLSAAQFIGSVWGGEDRYAITWIDDYIVNNQLAGVYEIEPGNQTYQLYMFIAKLPTH